MPKLDRYLTAEFTRAIVASLVILGMVSMGGVFADLVGEMARGKVPPALLLSQLGLRLLGYLPLILPLALLLGLLLATGRLYRDSEMHVLHAIGIGPRRLLRPLLLVMVPMVMVIGLCSLLLGPWANRLARGMVIEANKNLLVPVLSRAGLPRWPMAAWPTWAICRTMAPKSRMCSFIVNVATAWMWPPRRPGRCIAIKGCACWP